MRRLISARGELPRFGASPGVSARKELKELLAAARSHEAVRFPLERALMEYRVEITIPEAREDIFVSIFEALVDEPNSVAAVGDMDRTGPPSHLVLAVDAVDAHEASTTAVQLFRDAVARSGVEPTADTAILDLHADRVPEEDKLHDSDELQTA